jgi:hypothetical protein
MNVPDERYYPMNVITWWTLLPDERYYLMNVITWWTYLMNVITWWTYLMNVIPETILVYYINISTFFNNGDALINQKVTDYIFLSCNGVILDTNKGVK